MQEMQVLSLGREDPLEEGTATLSSILGWRIPWTEEPNGIESLGLQRVGHDLTLNELKVCKSEKSLLGVDSPLCALW